MKSDNFKEPGCYQEFDARYLSVEEGRATQQEKQELVVFQHLAQQLVQTDKL